MRTPTPSFLPDRLRPPSPRRGARRGLAVVALLPPLLLAVPGWRLRTVDVERSQVLPAAARDSLAELVGSPVLLLDLDQVRRQVEVWPGVEGVEVVLDLPARLRVAVRPSRIAGSVLVGRRWHGVAANGELAGPLPEPVLPSLEHFGSRSDELWRGLEVARRLGQGSGAAVEVVSRVTPADWAVRLRLAKGANEVSVEVGPEATAAERFWCREVRAGARPAQWTDLRSQRRLVMTAPPGSAEPAAGEPSGGGEAQGGPA